MRIVNTAPIELEISDDKASFIIERAREFDAKVTPVEPDPGSNPADDDEREILQDLPDDATADELKAAIDQLNEDEIVDLIALAWVGRGDFDRSSWREARRLALERHRKNSSPYLMGIPRLGDFIADGLAELGHNVE